MICFLSPGPRLNGSRREELVKDHRFKMAGFSQMVTSLGGCVSVFEFMGFFPIGSVSAKQEGDVSKTALWVILLHSHHFFFLSFFFSFCLVARLNAAE